MEEWTASATTSPSRQNPAWSAGFEGEGRGPLDVLGAPCLVLEHHGVGVLARRPDTMAVIRSPQMFVRGPVPSRSLSFADRLAVPAAKGSPAAMVSFVPSTRPSVSIQGDQRLFSEGDLPSSKVHSSIGTVASNDALMFPDPTSLRYERDRRGSQRDRELRWLADLPAEDPLAERVLSRDHLVGAEVVAGGVDARNQVVGAVGDGGDEVIGAEGRGRVRACVRGPHCKHRHSGQHGSRESWM
jgi:hypothetical protein